MNDERFTSCGRLLEDWVKGSGLDARQLMHQVNLTYNDYQWATHGDAFAVLRVLVALAEVYPMATRIMVNGAGRYLYFPRPVDKG